jgi:polyhydroxyalkanoate synthesis regulator phasin
MKKGILEKVILSGLGLASLTQDKVQKLVDELVKEGEMSDKDAAVMAKRIADNFERNRKETEKKIEKTVKDIMGEINISSKKDIAALEKKINELSKKIDGKK